ncbi:hypothetical protein PCH_Pc21g06120 [Penicillium rubens Wisconsin 54-1255]|uniref:Uncharacterized protein n=1 Tax=Penicillium rubens (strain ATCC 28089 / DSM 1075 / NRRL 1951 / Wisconsin 54-1255) TaxID=500485 RepID=B6HIG9_PENRW|nr:hypothetical protein PCH_Pc21g06120 [Penicillium rubens Wisconsin 54-1255]
MVLGVERRVEGLNWSGYEYFDWRGRVRGVRSRSLWSFAGLIGILPRGRFQLGLTMDDVLPTSGLTSGPQKKNAEILTLTTFVPFLYKAKIEADIRGIGININRLILSSSGTKFPRLFSSSPGYCQTAFGGFHSDRHRSALQGWRIVRLGACLPAQGAPVQGRELISTQVESRKDIDAEYYRMRMSSQGGIMGYRAMGISESYRWPESKSKAHGWIF